MIHASSTVSRLFFRPHYWQVSNPLARSFSLLFIPLFSRTDVVGPPTTQIESSFRCPFKGRASVTQSSGDLFRKTSNCFLSRASAFVQSIAFFCRAEEFSSLRFFVIIVSVSLPPHTEAVYLTKINRVSFIYPNQDVFNTDNISGRSICFQLLYSPLNIYERPCLVPLSSRCVSTCPHLFVVTFSYPSPWQKRKKFDAMFSTW